VCNSITGESTRQAARDYYATGSPESGLKLAELLARDGNMVDSQRIREDIEGHQIVHGYSYKRNGRTIVVPEYRRSATQAQRERMHRFAELIGRGL